MPTDARSFLHGLTIPLAGVLVLAVGLGQTAEGEGPAGESATGVPPVRAMPHPATTPHEAPRPARPPVEATQPLPPVRELLAALDSPRYRERERATHLLSRHDADAVAQIAEAARSNSPEVAIRAMNALEGLWLRATAADNDAASAAAVKAMDDLGTSDDPRLVRRVNAIYAMHATRIHEYSIAQIRKLGGAIRFNRNIQTNYADGTDRPSVESVIVGRDWTGGVSGLRHVRRVSPSAVYFIHGADLPKNIVAMFQAASPGIRAVPRGASQLGIESTNLQLAGRGCLVTGVETGSAADKAGIREGDLIQRFNDTKIASFNALVEQIKTIEPGRTVPATIQRNGETIEMEVTMQGWN